MAEKQTENSSHGSFAMTASTGLWILLSTYSSTLRIYERDLLRIAATADRNADPKGVVVELELEILQNFFAAFASTVKIPCRKCKPY